MGFLQNPIGWIGDRGNEALHTLGLKTNDVKPSFQIDPAAANINTGQSDQDRGWQQAFITSLQNAAAGNGPSLAQNQLQQATDANIRQAMALAQSGHGGYQASLRGALNAQSQAQQQSALQSAMLRASEQQNAMGMLGGALGGLRGQDIGLAQAQQGANMGMQQMQSSNAFSYDQLNAAQRAATADRWMKLLSAAGQGSANAGTLGAAAPGTAAAAAPIAAPAAVAPAALLSSGGRISGRAPTPGDSPSNDTVRALLSPGEIVLPRSVTEGPDAPAMAAHFVAALQAHGASKGYSCGGVARYFDGGDVKGGTSNSQMPPFATAPAPERKIGWGDILPSWPSSPTPNPFPAVPANYQDLDQLLGHPALPPFSPESSLGKELGLDQQSRSAPSFMRPVVGEQKPKTEDGKLPVTYRPPPQAQAAPTPKGSETPFIPGPNQQAMKDYKAKTGAALTAEEGALNAQGDIAVQKSKEESDIRKEQLVSDADFIAQQKQMAADHANEYRAGMDDYQRTYKQFADSRVDPHRMWASASTGDKILAGIGLALGSFSPDGVNHAVGVINQAIDRDIDAQKTDIGTLGKALDAKRGTLAEMRAKFGDDVTANAAQRNAGREYAIAKIEELAARTAGPQAKAQLAATIAQLRGHQATEDRTVEQQQEAHASTVSAENARLRLENRKVDIMAARAGASKGAGLYNAGRMALDELAKVAAKVSVPGNIPATAAADYNQVLKANASTIAAALNPGGKPPRTYEDAMKRIDEVVPGTYSAATSNRLTGEKLQRILRAMEIAQGAGVQGGDEPEVQ